MSSAPPIFSLSPLQGTPVYALFEDSAQTTYFGAELGLFQKQGGNDDWYWYGGTEGTEPAGEWRHFIGELPAEEQVGLPPVRAVLRGHDALWLGTEQGIARYRARSVTGLTLETILEAYPDLTTGRVHTIRHDERGLIWFGTDRGLLRYDGRDIWQYTEHDGWIQLGRADSIYPMDPREISKRGSWYFNRATGTWQRFHVTEQVTELRTAAEAAVTTILWTDSVAADKGAWDGVHFTSPEALPLEELVMRYKPQNTRIVSGGMPAAPRLPVGVSTWRYLSLEPEELQDGDLPMPPFWTTEGRFVPPPEHEFDPAPGRFDVTHPPPASEFDRSIFGYDPVVRIWLSWQAKRPFSILARLKRRTPEETFDPAVIDRVWEGMQQVRPVGARVLLAVEEQILRGNENG